MKKYEILKELVKFNTIKDKENKGIIDYIENYLVNLGFKTEHKEKSLIMSIGENAKVGFLGHTDTVNFTEEWKNNPLEIEVKDGKIYGLGVCDMKGGIAAILEAVSKTDLKRLKSGIKLYFTYDEEIGFGGAYEVIKKEKAFPEIMIFGEPTNNEIVVGTKGLLEYELLFKGVKVHSSNPEKGKSANMNAVKFLNELDEYYQKEIRKYENENYEIPYTTMNVGIIRGGDTKNAVSPNCLVTIDFRIAKAEQINEIKEKIEKMALKYDCEIKITECLEPFINKTELTEEMKTANIMTEASLINTKTRIILGLGPVTAHEVNEHITEESYEKLVKQYIEILEKAL